MVKTLTPKDPQQKVENRIKRLVLKGRGADEQRLVDLVGEEFKRRTAGDGHAAYHRVKSILDGEPSQIAGEELEDEGRSR